MIDFMVLALPRNEFLAEVTGAVDYAKAIGWG
jgi:hypothetical protein